MAQRPPFSSIQHFLLQDERHPQNFAWRGSCPPVSAHARWRCPGPPCSAIHGFYPHFRYPPKSVWLPCGKPDAFLFPQAGGKSFPEPPSQRPAGRIAPPCWPSMPSCLSPSNPEPDTGPPQTGPVWQSRRTGRAYMPAFCIRRSVMVVDRYGQPCFPLRSASPPHWLAPCN